MLHCCCWDFKAKLETLQIENAAAAAGRTGEWINTSAHGEAQRNAFGHGVAKRIVMSLPLLLLHLMLLLLLLPLLLLLLPPLLQ